MIRLRRARFDDLVRRQLDLFAVDEAGLLEEARTAEREWTRAGRDDAEEAFGDWQLAGEAVAERLLDLREHYAAGLGDDAARTYRKTFDRAAADRFKPVKGLLE